MAVGYLLNKLYTHVAAGESAENAKGQIAAV